MSIKKIGLFSVVCGVAMGLIGCGGSTSSSSGRYADNAYSDSSEGIRTVSIFSGEDISPEEELELLNQRIVHFAYDDSELTQQDRRVLNVHAKYMQDHPNLALRIDGHTDERGSREYNIALGERRAQSVEKFMQTKGVPGGRMTVVSYGKEQPIALGHDDVSYAENRRAELNYEDRD